MLINRIKIKKKKNLRKEGSQIDKEDANTNSKQYSKYKK